VLVLVGAVVGLAVAFTRGSSSSAETTARLPRAAVVTRLLRGIPQRGNVLGSAKAPVTMVEYIDLQCPGCQAFETQLMPDIVARYVRTGKLKVVARPIAFIGPDSERGRLAAVAAAEQNRFFNFAQLLYLNQGVENSGWLDDQTIEAAARSVPALDVSRLLAARTSARVRSQEQRYDTQATADRVSETPTILIGRSGSKPRQVELSSVSIAKAISAALQK
jgi:protein-disulfide isomerase